MANCPDARLHLQHSTWRDDRVRAAFTERAGAHSIAAERLVFTNKLSYPEALAEFNAIDIMLDTTPFSGSSITAEALWMGVPVVTLPNQDFSSRTSASLLTAIGKADWIANDRKHYIDVASSLASDIVQLEILRPQLCERMRGSSVGTAEISHMSCNNNCKRCGRRGRRGLRLNGNECANSDTASTLTRV